MKEAVQVGDNDILYVYKEPWFTGFAPCFDNGMYSLSCCKGKMRRNSIRHRFQPEKEKDIWILSIAGKDIVSAGHNESKNRYRGGDMICLVKIEQLLSWAEYSERYFGSRKDVIYTYDSSTNEMIWQKNNYHGIPECKRTDCGTEIKNYPNIKQIVLSNHYYLFKPGNRMEGLKTCRNYTFQNDIKMVGKYMSEHQDAYEFCGTFDITNTKSETAVKCAGNRREKA